LARFEIRAEGLTDPLTIFRICDQRFSPLSGEGAWAFGGRWNSIGVALVYACLDYSSALLEKLAHLGGAAMPPAQHSFELVVPAGVVLQHANLPTESDWFADYDLTRSIGDGFAREGRPLGLVVPGYVARPHQRNILLNPSHPDFGRIQVVRSEPVAWDRRLFGDPGDSKF
jgi:RES domain-containing protein